MEAIIFEETETESQRGVKFMSNLISFLSQIQTIVRDLKLIGGKMGPNNRKVVNAYTKFQDNHSPYEDVIKAAREWRNWIANVPDMGEDGSETFSNRKQKKKREGEEVLSRDVQELQAQNAALKKQLKEKETELAKKKDYISWMTQKHQQFLSRLPRGGETEAEDMIEKNLPEHVSEDYRHLMAYQWKDAIHELQQLQGPTKEDIYKLLCSILMVSEDVSKKRYIEIMDYFEKALVPLRQPFSETIIQRLQKELEMKNNKKSKKDKAKERNDEDEKKDSMPLSVKHSIEDYLRATSDKAETHLLAEATIKALAANASEFANHKVLRAVLKEQNFGNSLNIYINSASAMVWKMVVQTPPVIFKLFRTGPGNPFDDRVQEAMEESTDQQNHPYKYYVFPVLMLQIPNQPAKLLVKGKVVCDDQT